MIPFIGILQGRLTASKGRGIQFFPVENWRNEFKIAKEIGFDCMELLVQKDSLKNNPLWFNKGAEEIQELSDIYKIKIISVHGFYEKQSSYRKKLIHLVKQTALIGAKTILIPFFNENILLKKNDKDIARKQLSFALPLCKNLGIKLGIETEMAAEELLDFINSFKHPNIGSYYDIGNMASMNADVVSEIRLLGKLIYGVHVKDRRANDGITVALGEGCANFKSAFNALKQVGYNGPLIIHAARNSKINEISLNKQYFYFTRQTLRRVWHE
ncbi:MAG: sugar phosphate isomerase/epimerase family protein [Patescibacteria group bacterium]